MITILLTEYDTISAQYTSLFRDDPKDYNYEHVYTSNAIEGNTFSLSDTKRFLETGTTIANKTIEEHLDIRNLHYAYNHMMDLVNRKEPIDDVTIKKWHAILLQGRQDEVYPDELKRYIHYVERYFYPSPEKSKMLYTRFLSDYQDKYKQMHPLLCAINVHYDIVAIHPFQDGNGRLARLLFEMIVKQNGLIGNCFTKENSTRYIQSLQQSTSQNTNAPFMIFCINACIHKMETMLTTYKYQQKKKNLNLNF